MQDELKKELDDDKAVQELLECWCTTGVKEKPKVIELAESRIAELEAALGEALAKINEFKSKRKATQEEQYADQKALDESEEMRMKENKECRRRTTKSTRGSRQGSPGRNLRG